MRFLRHRRLATGVERRGIEFSLVPGRCAASRGHGDFMRTALGQDGRACHAMERHSPDSLPEPMTPRAAKSRFGVETRAPIIIPFIASEWRF